MNTHQMYQQANAQWQPVKNNPVVPYPMLQPTSGQQVPTNYTVRSKVSHIEFFTTFLPTASTGPRLNYVIETVSHKSANWR